MQKDIALRAFLLYGMCFFSLTGCVNYLDIKPHSTPLTSAQLSRQQAFYPPHQQKATSGWWRKFHDPELDQLETTALRDSPNMGIALSRLRKAQEMSKEVSSNLWPNINLDGSLERERFSKYGLVPPPFNGLTFNIADIGLNLNYELDLWGKNRQLLAASVSEQCAAAADVTQAALLLSAAVADTYFALLNSVQQYQIARRSWMEQTQMLAIIRKRAHQGVLSYIPVNQLVIDSKAARVAMLQYQNMQELAAHQLAILLGKNPAVTVISPARQTFHHYNVNMQATLPANLIAVRPDIRAARLRAEAAMYQVNVAKTRFFPNINLGALFSYQSIITGKLFNPESQNNAISAAFDLPIFDAGARRAQLGERYAEYDDAVNQYNQIILNALREVADELSLLKSSRAQWNSQVTSLQAAQDQYRMIYAKYRHGIIDYLAVLENRQELLKERAHEMAIHTRYLQAVVGTYKALGGNVLA